MLPTALKIAWTTLSLTGLLSSWLSFSAFCEAVDGLWLPVAYCLANTALQAIFCLGLIWHMNPYRMPRAFCIAQTYIIDGSWCALTGLSTCITLATTTAIFRRPCVHRSVTVSYVQRAMRWRFVYSLILLIFPALALVAFVIVSVKLDAIRPFDSITCDVSHTVQIRLLSYAGFPLIFAVPSFLSTCVTAMRLYQSQLHSRRGPYFPPPLDNFTPLPTRRQNRRPKRSSATLETLASSTLDHHSHFPDTEIRTRTPGLPLDSTLVAPPVPAITVSALSVSTHAITTLPNTVSAAHPLFSPGRAPSLIAERRQYHLPFSWKPPIPRSSSESRRSVQNRSSETPSPMMFAPPSDPPSLSNTPAPLPVFPSFAVQKALSNVWKKDAMWEEPDEVGSHIGLAVVDDEVDVEEASRTSPRWARNSDELSIAKSELRFAHDHQAYDYEEFDLPYASSSPIDHSAFPPVQPESPPAHQSPKVWRLLFFQLLSSVTQILASVSSLVDITTHRDMPTPFGTQHVALLLAAWAPCIAFGVQPWGRRPPS